MRECDSADDFVTREAHALAQLKPLLTCTSAAFLLVLSPRRFLQACTCYAVRSHTLFKIAAELIAACSIYHEVHLASLFAPGPYALC